MVKLEPKKLKTNKEVRTILPEDKYLDKLEKIIVRDYFPELPKLKVLVLYIFNFLCLSFIIRLIFGVQVCAV